MSNTIDYEQKSRVELQELEQQEIRINKLKNEISRLKLNKKAPTKEEVTQTRNPIVQTKEEKDDSFEDEVSFYLGNYRQLRDDFTEEEIKHILPKKKNPRFKDILLRLSSESIKEIKEVKEVLRTEELSSDEIDLCNRIIEKEKRKIEYIKSRLLVSEEVVEEQEEKNNIVLVPTLSGNIRIIDELEHIPNDYYEGFKELINSIIDGTFKNVKQLASNSNLAGITEVKGFKVRVVFTRLNYNTYALVTAFVKKTDTDKLYQESLEGKIRDYHLLESKLKENLNNPEFLEENEKNVQQLWNVLSPKEEPKKKEMI